MLTSREWPGRSVVAHGRPTLGLQPWLKSSVCPIGADRSAGRRGDVGVAVLRGAGPDHVRADVRPVTGSTTPTCCAAWPSSRLPSASGSRLAEIREALASLPDNRTPEPQGLGPAVAVVAVAARRADRAAGAAARRPRRLHRLRLSLAVGRARSTTLATAPARSVGPGAAHPPSRTVPTRPTVVRPGAHRECSCATRRRGRGGRRRRRARSARGRSRRRP